MMMYYLFGPVLKFKSLPGKNFIALHTIFFVCIFLPNTAKSIFAESRSKHTLQRETAQQKIKEHTTNTSKTYVKQYILNKQSAT
jgi:hypothetical protein